MPLGTKVSVGPGDIVLDGEPAPHKRDVVVVVVVAVVDFGVPLIVMVVLCNSADHYIFILWFLSSVFFFSSPNLSSRRLDVYHTSAHGVVLV